MQIGISLCLGANLRSGGASFSPASLFASGEEGALIQRRSDAFFVENTAETQAVDTNAVGFATDASEGAGYSGGAWSGLGPAVSVGSWTNASGAVAWDVFSSTGPSFTGEKTVSGGTDIAYSDVVAPGAVVGDFYLTTTALTSATVFLFDVRLSSAQNGRSSIAQFSPVIGDNSAVISANVVDGNFSLSVSTTHTGELSVSGASVAKIPGHHVTQATTSYKPTLQTGGLLFDGNDDRLIGLPAPATSGTIAARFNGSTASRVIFGSQAASDGRCFLALDASGKIAAGIGAQGTSTITGGSDIRSGWHTAAVMWDGSTVTLYLDGVSVYSAAQSGAVNTTVAMMLGALNANGSGAAFWAGTVSDALAIDRVLTTDEITNLNSYWSV